jgi:large subunit ribosomal protein L22
MQFIAKALYIPYSPYKLRPLAQVIRGKPVVFALGWLQTYKSKRCKPIQKAVASAVANAKNLKNINPQDLSIKEIRIDQGPQYRYYKEGAMGRSKPQRKRLCHISIVLEAGSLKAQKAQEEGSGT